MAKRKVNLTFDEPIPRRELVAQGRRLVILDLGGWLAVEGADDNELALRHQQQYLGHHLRVQFHTYFKNIARRAHNGWDQTHRRRLSNNARIARLAFANGVPLLERPPAQRDPMLSGPHLGLAAASALRKRETVRTGNSG